MDIGFASLIKEIDERLGRWASNLLLLGVIVTVLSILGSTVLGLYVDGVSQWHETGRESIIGLGKIALSIGIIAVLCVIVAWPTCLVMVRRMATKEAKKAAKDLEEHAERVADGVRIAGEEETKRLHELSDHLKFLERANKLRGQ